MDINESIAWLGGELDEWFDGSAATFASQNRLAQAKALLRGIKIANKLDGLKAHGLAAISALLNQQDAGSRQNERVASLIRGFVFGAKLLATLHDELLDPDVTRVSDLMRDIVLKLDAIEPDRASLAALLDHPNDNVRVCAGERLIHRMPERVIPVLRAIDEKKESREANLQASLALFAWDLKQKELGSKIA